MRVGEDYYLAVSSFEWFPGIPLYHSKDLKNWELVDYALKSVKYADLTGERASKGVWAPCLSYCEKEKRFYVFYSNIHGSNLWKMDIDNFLIWADEESIIKIILNTYKYVNEYIDKNAPGGKEHIGYIVDRTGFMEFKKWALEGIKLGDIVKVSENIYWSGIRY